MDAVQSQPQRPTAQRPQTQEVRPGEGRGQTMEVRPGDTTPSQPGVSREQPDTFVPNDGDDAQIYSRQDLQRARSGGGGGPVCSPTTHETEEVPDYRGDPTLDHNRRVCDPNLSNQPLGGDGRTWDGPGILRNLGQLDTTGQPGNQGQRCGPSSLLGGAVMAGPQATARFTERLAGQVTDQGQQQELNGIRDRLADGTATNADLNRVQEVAHQRYNTDGQWGLTSAELSTMHTDLAERATFDPQGSSQTTAGGRRDTIARGETEEQPGRTQARIGALRDGESFTLFVDTDRPTNGVNHFVQVGRDQDGRTYVYNPLQRTNQPDIIYQDESPQAFGRYVDGSMGDTSTQGVPGRVNVVAGATVQY